MEAYKFQKSTLQVAILLLFLLPIPFISSTMRPSYFYFLLNLLIVVLAVESGILTTFSDDHDGDKNLAVVVIAPRPVLSSSSTTTTTTAVPHHHEDHDELAPPPPEKKKAAAVVGEKVTAAATRVVHKLKRCPSVPSLFFIGSCDFGEDDSAEKEEEEEFEVATGEMTGQELFTRAEMFIGNFYKQLSIQREESWKKIHDALYHKKTF